MPPKKTITVNEEQFELGSQEATDALTRRTQELLPNFEVGDLTPQREANIPEIQTTGRADEEIARADQQQAQKQKEQEEQDVIQQEIDKRRERETGLIGKIRGLQGQKEKALVEEEEARGLTQQQESLNEVDQEIATMQAAHRERLQEIRTETGLTTQDVSLRTNREKNRHAFNLANQQIIRSAVEGSIERIQNAAARKIDLMFEGQEQEIELQKQFLDRNSQLLTEAKRKKLDQEIKKREGSVTRQREKVEELEAQKTNIIAEAARNGASPTALAQIRDAESVEEAFARAQGFLDLGQRALENRKMAERVVGQDAPSPAEFAGGEEINIGALKLTDAKGGTFRGLTFQEVREAGINEEDIQAFNNSLNAGFSVQEILNASSLTQQQKELLIRLSGANQREVQTPQDNNESKGGSRSA